jgi:hypothetical protein
MTSVWKLEKKGMPVHISSDAQSMVVASVTINQGYLSQMQIRYRYRMTSVWTLEKKGVPVHISRDAQSVVAASVTLTRILITNADKKHV